MQLRFVVVRLGQSQQDHGELLPGDLSLGIVAHTLQNGLLELVQVLGVVILQRVKRQTTNYRNTSPGERKDLLFTFLTNSSKSFKKPRSSSFSMVPLLSWWSQGESQWTLNWLRDLWGTYSIVKREHFLDVVLGQLGGALVGNGASRMEGESELLPEIDTWRWRRRRYG